MPIAKSESGPLFEPVPAGVHQAVCYSIVDLGTQPSFNPKFPARRKVLITWELPTETIVVKGETLPRAISKDYTLSLGKKANLRAVLESWRGKKFTEDELKGFDLKNILGVNCLINVVHEAGRSDPSRVFAKVNGVMPLTKGMPPISAVNKRVLFDIPDTGPFVIDKTLPEWVQAKIVESDEYKERNGNPAHTVDVGGAESTDDDKPY